MKHIFNGDLPKVGRHMPGRVGIAFSTPKANKVLIFMSDESAEMLFRSLGQVLGHFQAPDFRSTIEVNPDYSK